MHDQEHLIRVTTHLKISNSLILCHMCVMKPKHPSLHIFYNERLQIFNLSNSQVQSDSTVSTFVFKLESKSRFRQSVDVDNEFSFFISVVRNWECK